MKQAVVVILVSTIITAIITAVVFSIYTGQQKGKKKEIPVKMPDPKVRLDTTKWDYGFYSFMLYDSLGNEATKDSSGAWKIKGDTLALLSMMADIYSRDTKSVIMINDTGGVFYYRPGDTIRFTTCKK